MREGTRSILTGRRAHIMVSYKIAVNNQLNKGGWAKLTLSDGFFERGNLRNRRQEVSDQARLRWCDRRLKLLGRRSLVTTAVRGVGHCGGRHAAQVGLLEILSDGSLTMILLLQGSHGKCGGGVHGSDYLV